jgi:hypothetical protein
MESFWSGKNLKRIVRQSAIAADVSVVNAISATSPVFKVMVRPPSWIVDAPGEARGRAHVPI